MALPVTTVAKRFLQIAQAQGKTVDPLKLQKLVYLAHGWNLAFTGQPLVAETFQAWKYGPVCPSLYKDFKQFGAAPILPLPPALPGPLESGAEHIVQETWRVYGDRTGMNLSDMTHEPGSAWSQVFNGGFFNNTIPNDFIQNEFTRRRAA